MHWLLVLFAFAQLEAAPPALPKVRRDLKPGSEVATRYDGVKLALRDTQHLEQEHEDPGLTRYVFIPPNIEPASGFQQVAHIVNSTITRTAARPQPRLLLDEERGTAVVAVDLAHWAGNESQIGELVGLWERLAERDSFFNAKVIIAGDQVIEVTEELRAGLAVEIKLKDGTWGKATFKSRKGSLLSCEYDGRLVDLVAENVRPIAKPTAPLPVVRKTFTAEPYLNPEGTALFDITRSNVPILQLDEFVAAAFSTVNGGLYYELAGVEKNLGDTVAKFAGADAAKKVLRQTAVMRLAGEQVRKPGEARSIFQIAGEFDQELAKTKWVMNESNVTRRQRSGVFVAGANIAPAEGPQLVAVTFDLAEDNVSPDADPQRQLSVYETYNGGEAILAMPNGMLLYLVFDANDNIIASVPDTVAWDSKATSVRTNAGTVRVFSGASCMNCHDDTPRNWGWQPVRNDVAEDFRSLAHILGDRPKKGTKAFDKLQEIQRLASAYAGDDIQLAAMLDQSRLSYQRAVDLATGAKGSAPVNAGIADSYWSHWYDAVWPEDIVRDLGQVMARKDAQAFLVKHIAPNPDAEIPELFREDRVIARAKDGKSLTPAQYRAIAPEIAERFLFSQANHPDPVLEGMKP
jgi:hypothetical protein